MTRGFVDRIRAHAGECVEKNRKEMRSEIASVVTHSSGYGNAVVDGREKNR